MKNFKSIGDHFSDMYATIWDHYEVPNTSRDVTCALVGFTKLQKSVKITLTRSNFQKTAKLLYQNIVEACRVQN